MKKIFYKDTTRSVFENAQMDFTLYLQKTRTIMSLRQHKPYTLDRVVRLIIALILLVVTALLINRLSEVILPFLIAWLLAYLLYPLMQFFQYRLKLKNRILAITATLLTVFGVIALAGNLLIPPIIDQSVRASKLISEFLRNPNNEWRLPPQLVETAQNFLQKLDFQQYFRFDTVEGFVQSVLPTLWDIVSKASDVLLNVLVVFIVLLYLIFILLDYEKITSEWIHLIPKNYRVFVLQMGEDLKAGMNQYFRGQALISLLVGIGYAIGFSIIGLPMGIVFGISVGIMHLVPYLQAISLVPGIMLCAIKAAEYNQSFFWVFVSMMIVYTIMQLLIELVLTPRIMGKAMSMHPAIILLSLSIWGSLMGIVGMIIALPVTTILFSYYRRFIIDRGVIEDLVSPEWTTGQSINKEEKKDEPEKSVETPPESNKLF
jgi:predicted PurR-regulated permease PerM